MQKKIVLCLAEALLSDADDQGRAIPPERGWLEGVVDDFDKMLGAGSPDIRRGMTALVLAIETLPSLVVRKVTRMSELPLAERVAYLGALESSRVGLLAMVFMAFKLPLAMIAYDHGEGLACAGLGRSDLSVPRGNVPVPKPEGAVLSPREGVRA